MAISYMEPPTDAATEAQLHDLDRRIGGHTRLARFAAISLLIVFSLGSLISISVTPLTTFLIRLGQGSFDAIDLISVVVNLLMVLAMDVSLMVAADKLRALTSVHAPWSQKWTHTAIMGAVCIVEGVTFLYLAWQFDHVTNIILWLIIGLRAFGAPIFTAYLSLAQSTPVLPEDVAYHTSLAAGRGLIKDVARHAADPSNPMSEKAAIYKSAAYGLTPSLEKRFDGIIAAVAHSQAHKRYAGPTNAQGAQEPQIVTARMARPTAARATTGRGTAVVWEDLPLAGQVYRATPSDEDTLGDEPAAATIHNGVVEQD